MVKCDQCKKDFIVHDDKVLQDVIDGTISGVLCPDCREVARETIVVGKACRFSPRRKVKL
jgi:hypothetical protein